MKGGAKLVGHWMKYKQVYREGKKVENEDVEELYSERTRGLR